MFCGWLVRSGYDEWIDVTISAIFCCLYSHMDLLLSDSPCLRENTRPERSEDTSRVVTVVLGSTESTQEVEVMPEVNTTTEF